MSTEPATSPEKISKWIRDAASEPWRPGHLVASGSGATSENCDFRATRIEASLERARLKTYVKMIKPFRGMFRNQGAVNDSLIEAVSCIAAQNEELMEEISELRGLVASLRSQIRPESQANKTPESPPEASKG